MKFTVLIAELNKRGDHVGSLMLFVRLRLYRLCMNGYSIQTLPYQSLPSVALIFSWFHIENNYFRSQYVVYILDAHIGDLPQ